MSDNFIEGNVRERSLSEIWHDTNSFSYNRKFSEEKLEGNCHACKWGKLCRGGCKETSFSMLGRTSEFPYCLYHLETSGALPPSPKLDK